LAKPALDCAAVGWSAHFTFSFARPLVAAHQLSATTATPDTSPSCSSPPSTTKASRTPFTALAAARSALATLAPNTGAFS
jgi:hypothetical protein